MSNDNFLKIYDSKLLVKNNLVGIVGIILFTDAHPYVIKCLRDNDFWNALNEQSGKRWVIYSIKPQAAKLDKNPFLEGGNLGHLVPIWDEPNSNKLLIERLDIKDTSILPIFTIAYKRDDELLVSHIDIDNESIDTTYRNISKIIQGTTSVVDKISEENIQNTDEIFSLLKSELSHQRFVKRAIKIDKFWRDILERLPI